MSSPSWFATAPKGFADLLAIELRDLGALHLKESVGGVAFEGPLETGYRACLWSRVANRILRELGTVEAASPDELYAGVRQIDWSAHIGPDATIACEFTANRSPMTHAQYATLRVKDAIVDQLRELRGARPSVDTATPDVRVHVHASGIEATISIDFAGDSLHRRGYRERGVPAPLKENLAAGLLLRAGWSRIAAEGGAFVDPMCGSGTLPIEAALIAFDIAPGLLRERFGFQGWRQHDPALWQRLLDEAKHRREEGVARSIDIRGFDHDANAVRVAIQNVERAQLRGRVHVERRELTAVEAPASSGLLVTNPPYGERIGHADTLKSLYETLGERLRSAFQGWNAAVLVADAALGRHLHIKARRVHNVFNGPIECRLLRFEIDPRWFEQERAPGGVILRDPAAARARPGAQMFANRLSKNVKALEPWARRDNVHAWRLYDADMPEYAFAIDLYEGQAADRASRWLVVQEYAAPRSVDEQGVRQRRDEALSVLTEVTGVELSQVYFRTRKRRRAGEQYEKRGARHEFRQIEEGGLRFLVNFTDYLDTGLFLDHRPTRALIRELAQGRRFLNLFGYTGTASVYAAAGGASATLTIDMSRTYLDWARRNLESNGFGPPRHQLLQADALRWLDDQAGAGALGPRFGLIFLDPPTFSNSKRMREELDIQRDHTQLIRAAAALLAPGGILIFSTNAARFRMDKEALAGLAIEDISARTLPPDFARNPRIHHAYRIEVPVKP
jgi:23S rRNA (guanine2445-N2)-methyltransferase / 23S rRNA (guanine2069-N7)-methyltransferase